MTIPTPQQSADAPRPGTSGTILRLQPAPSAARPGVRIVVTDTTWTARPGDTAIGFRDVLDRVLAERDFIVETSARLDAWAESAGIAERMAIDGTSYWFRDRLRSWLWLQELSILLATLHALIAAEPVAGIEVADGIDDALANAARHLATRDGLVFADDRTKPDAASPAGTPDRPEASIATHAGPPATPKRRQSLAGRIRARLFPDQTTRRTRAMRKRVRTLARSRRLLALLVAAQQRIDTPSGPELIDPFLGPVLQRFGTKADKPIELELRRSFLNDVDWAWLSRNRGSLPGDVLRLYALPGDPAMVAATVEAVLGRLGEIAEPLLISGVDLGPELLALVKDRATASLRFQATTAVRVERILREVKPRALILIDEYHRTEWLAGAGAAEVPTIAVQHGLIYARHNGYAHRSRPSSLRLPSRTYVFGRWERDLLVNESVYRPDEVVVGGSPRLSLVETRSPDGAAARADREAVRAELGIGPDERLVVVSGTWGAIYRRYHYPIALAHLVDRPLPGVHLVVKLHPGEQDEGPYRAVVEGAAAAKGFAPPPVTVVKDVDLYRLLAASDAHFGVHSTVLTEAIAAGTLNLLAATVSGFDLLGYIEAGVAVSVRNGGDVLDALARRDALLPDATTRAAFLDQHFEPGDGAGRIADDLRRWLSHDR